MSVIFMWFCQHLAFGRCTRHLEPKVGEAPVLIGPPPERPMKFPLVLGNGHVIDACYAQSHKASLVEFPVLVAIRSKPISRVVVPLIGKTYRNAVTVIGPEFLDQAVVEFSVPLSDEELNNRFTPHKELGSIAPSAIWRVGKRDALRVARIPGIFRHAH